MSRVYTVAVVGAGIGRSHVTEGYLPNSDRFKVIAICDLNTERMTALADEFGVERRVQNFDDLLAMPDLDIIDVCTPPMVHFPQVMAALKSGKHAVCEKPAGRLSGRVRRRDCPGETKRWPADADLPV